MITTINEFRNINESLSRDRANAAKLAQLIDLSRQMIENYKKAEEFAVLKASKNADVAEVLERMNKTSVIAEGVLIEVFKPYTMKRVSNADYFEFVNSSVGVINEDFRILSEQIHALSTKLTGGTSYIRTNKNPKNVATGIMTAATITAPSVQVPTTESLSSIWSSIKDWFVSFKETILNMLPTMELKLNSIKQRAIVYQNTDIRVGVDLRPVGNLRPSVDHRPRLDDRSQNFKHTDIVHDDDHIDNIKNTTHLNESNVKNDPILLWNEYMKLVEIVDGIMSEHGELSNSYWKDGVEAEIDRLSGHDAITINYINKHKVEIIKSFADIYDGLKGWTVAGHNISRYGKLSKIKIAEILSTKENKIVIESFVYNEHTLEDIIEDFLKQYITKTADYRLDHDTDTIGTTTIMLYVPADDVLFDIKNNNAMDWDILQIFFDAFCVKNNLYNGLVSVTDGYTDLVFMADTNIIDPRESCGSGFNKYQTTKNKINELGRPDLDPELSSEDVKRAAVNKYSREYKQSRRDQTKNITDVLAKAKEAIEAGKQEAYYNTLGEINEKMIKQLLTELNAKSIAIDDKILSLIKMEEKQSFDMTVYEAKMTNAVVVGEAVVKMTQALIGMHKKIITVSGSTRQIGDTSNSPDGTFNMHFDHETKTVIPARENKTNESVGSWMSKMWANIKTYFASFKRASKDMDSALSAI